VQFLLYQFFKLYVDSSPGYLCTDGVINDGDRRLPGSSIVENEYPIYATCVFACKLRCTNKRRLGFNAQSSGIFFQCRRST
jgi:hypothetical protein